MQYIAFDVAKEELVSYHGTKISSCKNNSSSIQKFLGKFSPEKFTVGFESTGDYHLNLAQTAIKLGFPCKIINPKLTQQITKTSIRGTKTDPSDAKSIHKILSENFGKNISLSDLVDEKKVALRLRSQIVSKISDLKKIQKNFLLKQDIMDISDCISSLDRAIETLGNEVNFLEEKSLKKPSEQEKLLESIPGFGKLLSAVVSVEAGDISRFDSAKQLKAFVGIDSRVSQSGNFCRLGSISKAGNKFLRTALFLAASVARRFCPELREFYEKLREKGKPYRVAICAVIRKLCERIFAMSRDQKPYCKFPLT